MRVFSCIRHENRSAEQPSQNGKSSTRTSTHDLYRSAQHFLSSGCYSCVFTMLNTQIHRQQSLVYVGRTRRETLRILGYAVDALRQADVILAKMANDLGWIRAGVLTYATRDNNIMMKGAYQYVDINTKSVWLRNVQRVREDIGPGRRRAESTPIRKHTVCIFGPLKFSLVGGQPKPSVERRLFHEHISLHLVSKCPHRAKRHQQGPRVCPVAV